MPTTTVAGHSIEVNEEGFMTQPEQWTEEIGRELAALIGVTLTEAHWSIIRFLREDFDQQKTTATLRRVSTQTGTPVKTLFELFPVKPAKKMSYIAGLPKPQGCV